MHICYMDTMKKSYKQIFHMQVNVCAYTRMWESVPCTHTQQIWVSTLGFSAGVTDNNITLHK